MKKLRAVIKSQAGETIAEVLIALLISALALTMLAVMISSSSGMIRRSSDVLEGYYSDSPQTSGNATVTISFNESAYTYSGANVITDRRTLAGKTITGYHIS